MEVTLQGLVSTLCYLAGRTGPTHPRRTGCRANPTHRRPAKDLACGSSPSGPKERRVQPGRVLRHRLGTLSFTLLGLWWVVAERRRTWFDNAHHRRMAYVVSLHFMLPGAMSVLSLVDSTGTFFWRLVFALAGIAGMVGALMVSSTITSELGQRAARRRDAVDRVAGLRAGGRRRGGS